MGLFLHLRDHFFLFLFALSLSPFSLLLLRAFVVKLNPLFTFYFCLGSFSVPSAPPPCLRGKIKPTFYFFLLPWISSTVILKGSLPSSADFLPQILKHSSTSHPLARVLLHLSRVVEVQCDELCTFSLFPDTP